MKLPKFLAPHANATAARRLLSQPVPSSARNEAPTGPAPAFSSSEIATELDRLRSLTLGLAQAADATPEAVSSIAGRFDRVIRLAGSNPALDEAGRVVDILQTIPDLHGDLRAELEGDLFAAVRRSCGLHTVNPEIAPCLGERYRDALAPHEPEDF